MRKILLFLLALCLNNPSSAETWPSKPIRLLVAYPAGGVSDNIARLLAEKLAIQLATPVLVENRAGASGSIGVDAAAKAAPDGYTLVFSAISPLTLNPHISKTPFDPFKDITPVASVMYSPVLLLATPALKARDFDDLLAIARGKPGAVRWSTSGQASLGHIMQAQLSSSAKVSITHIPYKGGGQQITDALGGQFEVLSVNASAAVMQHIKAGKLQALAVGAPSRMDALPSTPTLAELGFPSANLMSLFGIFSPAGLPPHVLSKLNLEINKALALADVRARLKDSDNVVSAGTSADFAKRIKQEFDNNARIIQLIN